MHREWMYISVVAMFVSAGCGATPAASGPIANVAPSPPVTSSCSPRLTCTLLPFRISGDAVDDDGRPVTGARVTVYPFIFGAGGGEVSTTTDVRGFYEIAFDAMQDAVGGVGSVVARRDGHELDGHYLSRPSAQIVHNFRLYRVRRIAPDASVTVTVLPEDPPCGYEWEWVCRTVRIVPMSPRTPRFSLFPYSAGGHVLEQLPL